MFTFGGKEAHSTCLNRVLIGSVSFDMLTKFWHKAVIFIKLRGHQLKWSPPYFHSHLFPTSVLCIPEPFHSREQSIFGKTLVLAQRDPFTKIITSTTR